MANGFRIESMLSRIDYLLDKYGLGARIPYSESLTLSHEFMKELCERLLALEEKVNNG